MSAAFLLAIESSCDETAAAVVSRDRQVLSNVIDEDAWLNELAKMWTEPEFSEPAPFVQKRAWIFLPNSGESHGR